MEMDEDNFLDFLELSNAIRILSPKFKKIKAFRHLLDKEKEIYNIISTFFNNDKKIHPFSQLIDFFQTEESDESSWKRYFVVLCTFLDHQTIKMFANNEEKSSLFARNYSHIILRGIRRLKEEKMFKKTSDLREKKKRHFDFLEENENFPIKKRRRDDFNDINISNNRDLLFNYLVIMFEGVSELFNQYFPIVSKEKHVSDNSRILEKSFYNLIGLKYTYYSNSFLQNSSFNIKKHLLSYDIFSEKIGIFDQLKNWCIERNSIREAISSQIERVNDEEYIKHVLKLPSNASNEVVEDRFEVLLNWLLLPNEVNSDSEHIYRAYIRLLNMKSLWESKNTEDLDSNKSEKEKINYRSDFQRMVINFVLEKHNEQKGEFYNPFWTLGLDPCKVKERDINVIRKKLLFLTHPDKIIDNQLKIEANEAHIIIKNSIRLISDLLEANPNCVFSFPKGPELSYDFHSYLKEQNNTIKVNIPEILEMDASMVLDLKKTIKLPPEIEIKIKLSEYLCNDIVIKTYVTVPFVGSNILIEKDSLLNNIFISCDIKVSQVYNETFWINSESNIAHFKIGNLLFTGYPGITEISYFIGVQLIGKSQSKISWKKIRTKIPTENELFKGFSKNDIKSYLELYCRTWSDRKRFVQNAYTTAELQNVIHGTARKTELIRVLINLMENAYKYGVSTFY